MQIHNYTPFSPLVFETHDLDIGAFYTAVVRGTFSLVDGGPLRPSPFQEPIVPADRYRGSPESTSLLVDSDLAPYKPGTDIHVEAVAQAPGGRPATDWLVSLRLGEVWKTLRVTGPRWFRHSMVRGWALSDPEPCTAVPIHYELAFGGTFRVEKEAWSFEQNPVGRGFVELDRLSTDIDVSAPQIEDPRQPALELGQARAPEGFGPIARAWSPRRERAGKLDSQWLEKRWPHLPEDFDYGFHNSAHPDLVYPGFVKGDEVIIVHGVHPDGPLRTQLPGYKLAAVIKTGRKRYRVSPCALDTVRIDTTLRTAQLTWRATFPADRDAGLVKIHMSPEGKRHGIE